MNSEPRHEYIAFSIEPALVNLESTYRLQQVDINEMTMQVLDSFLYQNSLEPIPHKPVKIEALPVLSGSPDAFRDNDFQQKIH